MIDIEPSEREFKTVEDSICDIMSRKFPGILTKMGSVVRELVVRPLAYLLSWGSSNLDYLRRASSAAVLRGSSRTDTQAADELASNYFIERRGGLRSRGALTANVRFPTFQLPAGALFSASGTNLVTEHRIVAADAVSYGLEGDVMYVPLLPLGDGTFVVSIPVVAEREGPVEIAAGTPVSVGVGNSDMISVELSSAVTGGSGTETDADLMARAAYSTGEGGLGSLLGIRKVLDRSPVAVTGLSVTDGDSGQSARARRNWTGVNPGGMVDCHVRTQVQLSVRQVFATSAEQPDGSHLIVISGEDAAGCVGVVSLDLDGRRQADFEVRFSGDRLGADQRLEISFSSPVSGYVPAVVGLSVMPGISELQRFVNSDANRFAGQDLLIRAAVPVSLKLSCALRVDARAGSGTERQVRDTILTYVNSLEVGRRALNFSGIAEKVAEAVPGAAVRLPCVISADLPLRDGSLDTSCSDSGIMDLGNQANPDVCDWRMCYFSLIDDNLRLELE